jgi:hypothetical protein
MVSGEVHCNAIEQEGLKIARQRWELKIASGSAVHLVLNSSELIG